MRDQGQLDPVSQGTQILLLDHVARLNHSMGRIDYFWQGVRSAEYLREENARLRAQVRAAEVYLSSAERLERQNSRLRQQLKLDTHGRKRLAADIVHYVPYDNRITLNRGSKHGVRANVPVVTPEGILALVSTVSESSCQATLLTSSGLRIGGVALLSSPVPGLVKGEKSDLLVMDVFDNVEVPPGTEVITTGYSEFIPRGLRIGIVSEYYNDREYGVRRAFIVPSSRIGMSKEVSILL